MPHDIHDEDIHLSLPASFVAFITGLSTYSIIVLVPVLISTLAIMPGDSGSILSSTRSFAFGTAMRAVKRRPCFSSSIASSDTSVTAPSRCRSG